MTNAAADRDRRSRRRVVAGGVVALVALFVLGAAVQVPAMEDELTTSAEQVLGAAQLDVGVSFSGQDAVLTCLAPLDDADAARAAVAAIDGVREVTVDSTCSGASGSATTGPGSIDSISSDGGTEPPTTVGGGSTTTVPSESSPSSTTGSSTTVVVVAPEPGVLTITYQKGRLAMMGKVGTEAQHAALLTAAAETVDPANITDGVVDDATVTITDDEVAGLVAMMRAMTVPLVAAELTWRPDGAEARGMFTDDGARAAFEAAAREVGVEPLLVPRPIASEETAAALGVELNQLVASTPIEFDKGQTTVSAASAATLERVAGIAKSLGGIIVQVQGHTDSEGDAGRNQTLSDQRAEAVRAELVRLGVLAADVTSMGFGESQLIVDANGVELRDQSRRVVFDVVTTSG